MKINSFSVKNTRGITELKSSFISSEKSFCKTREPVNNEQEIDYEFYSQRAKELRSKEVRKMLSSIKQYVLSLNK